MSRPQTTNHRLQTCKGFTPHMPTCEGFTLIEILVVIAIIGILSSVVLASVNTARAKAKIARAQADLRELRTAISILELDTGLMPGATSTSICVQAYPNNELYLDTPEAGVEATDGGFGGWNGPYMNKVPLDPWGGRYIFDSDYQCTMSPLAVGCEKHSGDTVRAIQSPGPNGSGFNAYDTDDIVMVLCAN